MKTQTDKSTSTRSKAAAGIAVSRQAREEPENRLEDNRAEIHAQRKLAGLAGDSRQAGRIAQMQEIAASFSPSPIQRQGPVNEKKLEEESIQHNFATMKSAPRGEESPEGTRQRQVATVQYKIENALDCTGLPDRLKSRIDSLASDSMDNVEVRYSSSQPSPLNAPVYVHGADVHVTPGQEQRLSQEHWHVVQQSQERRRPTRHEKDGVPVNGDHDPERGVDETAEKFLQIRRVDPIDSGPALDFAMPSAAYRAASDQQAPIQRDSMGPVLLHTFDALLPLYTLVNSIEDAFNEEKVILAWQPWAKELHEFKNLSQAMASAMSAATIITALFAIFTGGTALALLPFFAGIAAGLHGLTAVLRLIDIARLSQAINNGAGAEYIGELRAQRTAETGKLLNNLLRGVTAGLGAGGVFGKLGSEIVGREAAKIAGKSLGPATGSIAGALVRGSGKAIVLGTKPAQRQAEGHPPPSTQSNLDLRTNGNLDRLAQACSMLEKKKQELLDSKERSVKLRERLDEESISLDKLADELAKAEEMPQALEEMAVPASSELGEGIDSNNAEKIEKQSSELAESSELEVPAEKSTPATTKEGNARGSGMLSRIKASWLGHKIHKLVEKTRAKIIGLVAPVSGASQAAQDARKDLTNTREDLSTAARDQQSSADELASTVASFRALHQRLKSAKSDESG